MKQVFSLGGVEIYTCEEEEDDGNSYPAINQMQEQRIRKQAEEGYDNSIMTAPVVGPDENIGDTFMLPSTRENIETLLEWLKDESIKVIAIEGEEGMGKTWTAKHLMQRAVADKLFELCIWVDSDFGEEATVQVAEQLGFTDIDDSDVQEAIHRALCDMHFLLIYDCRPRFVGAPEGSECTKASKCVVVREESSRKGPTADKILQIQKLSEDEAWLWFATISSSKLIQEIDLIKARQFLQPFINTCDGVPFKIAELSRTIGELSSVSLSNGILQLPLLTILWKKFDHLLNPQHHNKYAVMRYNLPKIDDVSKGFLSCEFYKKYCYLSARDFVSLWMKSGFFDGFNCLEKAYAMACNMLNGIGAHMSSDQLRQISFYDNEFAWQQKQEYIPITGFDFGSLVSCTMISYGPVHVQPSEILMMDGNLDVFYPTTAKDTNRSFLLYGNEGRYPDVLPDGFFEAMSDRIEDVSLLHIGIKTIPTSISKLCYLKVLVVRNCTSLRNVSQLRGFSRLRVLSFSGCSSLKEIPDDFFDDVRFLKTLDLSNTQLKELPFSFSKLSKIKFLVLRGCSSFKALPPLEESNPLVLLDLSETLVDRLPPASCLRQLEYLILSGCSLINTVPHPYSFPLLKLLDLSRSAFRGFQDEPSASVSFLIRLDLSKTQITHIPPLLRCVTLREVYLRNCPNLVTLPFMGGQVEILDLSSSSSFTNLQADMIGDSLGYLDLSRTQIREFSVLSTPLELILQECEQLEELPKLDFQVLQVLDLAGSINFQKLDITFEAFCSLKTLNLSATKVSELPSLSKCVYVRSIILKGCLQLETLPELRALGDLEVLDISGATKFKQFEDDSFGEKEHFRELNLSGTQVVKIPIISGCHNLCKLILGDCSQLETVPDIETLEKLQELDISGVTCFESFPEQFFEKKYDLHTLDISGTQIEKLPSLSKCINLSKILLRDCQKLVTVPSLKGLTKLEVLDLSGDTSFSKFNGDALGSECALKKLDLSRTKFIKFQFFSSCKNLCQLSLRGCSNLDTLSFKGMLNLQKLDLSETSLEILSSSVSELENLRQLLMKDCSRLTMLPSLEKLTTLEELDLSGNTSFCQLLGEVLGSNCTLQKLDVSRTKVRDFSFLSNSKNLRQLSLQGCSNLETLSFDWIPNLQKLDLSESPITTLPPSFVALHNLHHLTLKGCSRLVLTSNLEFPAELEVLDLSCMSIEFPLGILKLNKLRFLAIFDRKFIWNFKVENAMEVMKQLNLDLCHLDDFGTSCVHITVSNTDIFRFMGRRIELWGKCIPKLHFCLCSTEEWGREKDVYLQENGFDFKEIYYQTNNIPQFTDEPDKFLKICGFQAFPKGIEFVLTEVEVLYLKKNDFITRLSDLGAGHVKVMRECWVERCNKIETLFHEEETEENLALGRCLENLWVSNLSYLNCLFGGEMPSGSFSCLKHIYIDCCPRLTSVFSSYLELNTLETLEIKFCDQLVSLFRDRTVSGEETLPRLKNIVLCKLPKLQSICRGVLPALELLQVKGCPELQEFPASGNSNIFREKIKA